MDLIKKIKLRNIWFFETLKNYDNPSEETEVYVYDLIATILTKGYHDGYDDSVYENDQRFANIICLANEDSNIVLKDFLFKMLSEFINSNYISKDLFDLLATLYLINEKIIECEYRSTMPQRYDSFSVQRAIREFEKVKREILLIISNMAYANTNGNEKEVYTWISNMKTTLIELGCLTRNDYNMIYKIGKNEGGFHITR